MWIRWPKQQHRTVLKDLLRVRDMIYIPSSTAQVSNHFKISNASMMLSRIIFCSAVLLATLAVVLLALFSPLPKRKPSQPWLDLSLYIQQPHNPNIKVPQTQAQAQSQSQSDGGGAFIFHRMLTEGPENTSRVVGKAQGFILPVEHFAHSGFNIIYLTFHTPQHSGSLSVEAKHVSPKDTQELTVMGGTGSFSFARGLAVIAQSSSHDDQMDGAYHVNLQLRFPNQSRTILG